MITLEPQELSAENFSPYGRVIEAGDRAENEMNSGTFARFDDLAVVDYGDVLPGEDVARPTVSIVRSQSVTPLPHTFSMVECHPLCSQAFIPLAEFQFYVVVAAPAEHVEADNLQAFVTNGHQGISYHRGTWHLPLIAQEAGQEFLVVDQASRPGNLREHRFGEEIRLSPAV